MLGTGPTGLLVPALVPKWFVRNRGRAVATATMGTGLGAFTLPVVVSAVADGLGWRSVWVALAAMTAILTVVPALLLKTGPEDLGLRPDGDSTANEPGSPVAHPAEASVTAREAVRTTLFWLLVLAAVFAFLSLPAYPVHLVQIYDDQGFSQATAAAAFSGYGLTSFLSRFLWGYVADRLQVRRTLLLVTAFVGATLPLVLLLPGNSALLAGAITGLGIGGWVGLNDVVWAAYFGRAHLGAIGGLTRPFVTTCQAVSPLYVAALADAFGNYTPAVLAMTAVWWLSACCFLIMRGASNPPRGPRANPE